MLLENGICLAEGMKGNHLLKMLVKDNIISQQMLEMLAMFIKTCFTAADFGRSFRESRKSLGKTQQWVADLAGVRRETIVQLEAGENVGMHVAMAALAALGKGLEIKSEVMAMTSRDVESMLLSRCAAVAREVAPAAHDQREANVFRLAAMVVQSRFPRESNSLMLASNRYFAKHANERLAPAEVVRNGWVLSLPRLRDMLSHQLYGH